MIRYFYNYLKDKFQEHLPMFVFLYVIITILIILSIVLLYLDHEEIITGIDIIHHTHDKIKPHWELH
jgi:hypothetical protein